MKTMIIYSLEPPYFVSCLNDTRVMQGQPFYLKCDVKGPGNITVTWLYNNQPIWNEFLNISIRQEGKILSVSKAKPYHTGKYTCRAQNQFGTSSAVAYVQVHSKYMRLWHSINFIVNIVY